MFIWVGRDSRPLCNLRHHTGLYQSAQPDRFSNYRPLFPPPRNGTAEPDGELQMDPSSAAAIIQKVNVPMYKVPRRCIVYIPRSGWDAFIYYLG